MAFALSHVGEFDSQKEEVEAWIGRFKAACSLNGFGVIVEREGDNIDTLPMGVPAPVDPLSPDADGPAREAHARQVAAAQSLADALVLQDDMRRRNFLIAELGPTAYSVMRRKVLPLDPIDKTAKRLLQTLRDHYKASQTTNLAVLQFMQRYQNPEESLEEFVIALQELAAPCQFGDKLNFHLNMRLIQGVKDAQVRRKIMKHTDLPFDTLVQHARTTEVEQKQEKLLADLYAAQMKVETPKEEVKEPEPEQEEVHRVVRGRGRGQGFGRGQGRYQRGRGWFAPRGGGRQSFQPCHRCLRTDHTPDNCGAKNQECFSCRQKGHIARACSNRVHQVGDKESESQVTSSPSGFQMTPHYVAAMPGTHQQQFVYPQYVMPMQPATPEPDQVRVVTDNKNKKLEDYSSIWNTINVCYSNDAQEETVKRVTVLSNEDLGHGESEVGVEDSEELWFDAKNQTWRQGIREDKCDCGNYDATSESFKCLNQNQSVVINNRLSRKKRWLFNKRNKSEEHKYVKAERVGNVEYVHLAKDSDPLILETIVDNVTIPMEVDSGSRKAIMTKEDVEKYLKGKRIRNTPVILVSLSHDPLSVMGESIVYVKDAKGKCHKLTLIVCQSKKPFTPIMGREWLNVLVPTWRDFLRSNMLLTKSTLTVKEMSEKCTDDLECIKKLYPNCFSSDRSQAIKGYQVRLVMKENHVPLILKEYEVQYSLIDAVKAQLRKDVETKVAELVTRPEYASPMFAVPKPGVGKFRLCIDFKRSINKQLDIDYYPLPKPEDIYAKLAGGVCFSVIDLTEAYLQLEVEPDSRKYLTVNTPIGFLQYKRMPYGLASAPANFQLVMDAILKGLDGVFCYLDDVFIKGESYEDCVNKTHQVLRRLNEHNVRINVQKSKFFKKVVDYLGNRIDAEGRHPLPCRVQPIVECPRPENSSEVHSYNGMLNFYRAFLPNLSTELKPLYELQQKGVPFEWTEKHEASFVKSKKLLLENQLLVHYNPKLPIYLTTDASPVGISGVLSHRINGIDRPIQFFSRTLNPQQKKYAQIQREGLAIVSSVVYFHKYLAGRKFTLVTDNLPLKTIFSPDKGLPVIAANRLAHWAVILSAYTYNIEFRRSEEMGPADCLSRLPLPDGVEDRVGFVDVLQDSPLNYEIVRFFSETDICIQQVLKNTVEGWPSSVSEEALVPYFKVKHCLWEKDGCLFMGDRIVVPQKLQDRVLERLHDGHPGIVRTRMLARSHVWWPTLDKDIEAFSKDCEACRAVNFKPSSNIHVSWQDPGEHWVRVHIDLLEYKKEKFLILEDSHSKWAEIWHMPKSTDAKHVCEKLEMAFSVFGLPEIIVSDNGPPFQSDEFIQFCTQRLIVLKHVPYYSPKSNGQAERRVKTVKEAFAKFMYSKKAGQLSSTQAKIAHFLFTNRNTPSTVTGVTPASLAILKEPRTAITVLKPPKCNVFQTIPDRAKFQPNELVDVRFKNKAPIREGQVFRALGPTVYLVHTQDRIIPVHINQLRHKPVGNCSGSVHPPVVMQVPVMNPVKPVSWPVNVPMWSPVLVNPSCGPQQTVPSEASKGPVVVPPGVSVPPMVPLPVNVQQFVSPPVQVLDPEVAVPHEQELYMPPVQALRRSQRLHKGIPAERLDL